MRTSHIRTHRGIHVVAAGVILCLTLAVSGVPAHASARPATAEIASVVSDWNFIGLTTLMGDTSKAGQETILYLAFMDAAVYDAVVGVTGTYQSYRSTVRAPADSSATAAAAAAAHRLLETYSPYATAALDSDLAGSLSAVPDGIAKTNGVAFGELVAQHIIDLRADDGRYAPVLFTQPPTPGVWRPTPPAFLPMAVPWLGQVTPLLVPDADRFSPPPPPALTSPRYTRDLAEVQAYGSSNSAVRTPAQTATALFFSGNPFVIAVNALADQAATRHLDISETARMYAAVTMSMADALITTWHAKYDYGFWRPITAIRLADTDGNPATTADPTWTPLLTTPNYPEYTSGYNSQIASFSQVLERLFGPHLGLHLISPAAPGVVRTYDDAATLRADVVNARVWLGIHFRFGDEEARQLGVHLANWVVAHYFKQGGQ
jgi:hypothetical protein